MEHSTQLGCPMEKCLEEYFMFVLQIIYIFIYIATFPKRPGLTVFLCWFVSACMCVFFYDIGCFAKSQCNFTFSYISSGLILKNHIKGFNRWSLHSMHLFEEVEALHFEKKKEINFTFGICLILLT